MSDNPRTQNELPLWSVEESERPTTALPTPEEDVSLFSNTPRKQLENYFVASLFALVLLLVVFVISIVVVNQPNLFNNICQTTQCFHSSVVLLDAMNLTVSPCEDFYQFACGNWKPDYPADVEYGLYTVQSWATEQLTKQKTFLIGELRKPNSYDDPAGVRAVRRVFNACQNMAAINTVGLTSLWALLDKLGLPRHPLNTTGKIPWVRSLGRVARFLDQESLVGMSVTESVFNSSVNIITFFSPDDVGNDGIFGWNMDVFPEEKSPVVPKVNKWEIRVSNIIKYMIHADSGKVDDENKLLGYAESIYKILSIINRAIKAHEYPKYLSSAVPEEMNIAEFQEIIDESSTTGVSKLQIKPFLEEFFSEFPELNVDFNKEKLAVYRIRYYRALSLMLAHVSDSELELFIWWKVVYRLAMHTNENLIYLKDKMLRSLSNGNHPPLSRESVCYFNVIQLMKPSFGYFVIKSMDDSKLHQVESIANGLSDSLISTIKNQQWIDDTTRKVMEDKVRAIRFFVGVPEWMRNMTAFDELYRSRGENRPGVKEGQIPLYEFKHLENLVTLVDISVKKAVKRLRKTNTGLDEEFVPTLINAYYTSTFNSIGVPYGILDLPLFGWGNVALNYGSTGGFLGHELNHGFDTIGKDNDQYGNLRTLWSTESLSEHEKRTSCLIDQYSNFQLPDYYKLTAKLDGNLTVQENMADIGGLDVAFLAYKNYVSRSALELKMPGLQDYTNEQLFFLGFARAQCSKYSPIGLATMLNDVHPPSFVRTLFSLRNSPDFAKAWNCPKGSFMNPEKKCRLWS